MRPGTIGAAVIISKGDYKENWHLVPPLQYARPFWVNLYGAPDQTELAGAGSSGMCVARWYLCL